MREIRLLKTEALKIGYRSPKKEIVVTKDIDLSVNKNELVAIIGINGAGKSTLLKSLSKNLVPLSGSILLKGKSIDEFSPKQFSETLSLVLTEQSFSKNLSVFELVALGRQPYTNWLGSLTSEDIAVVNEALAQTGIRELAEKKCNELSDGQLQKVLISRALAQDTALVLMDEPTTHLDMYHKVYILQLLKKLTKSTGKAIIFATHEINLALQLCDRIILIHKGTAQQGSPEELISKGVFKDLFSTDFIRFDARNKIFRVVE
ncbi:MAG TPA: ABC transporter ATP-binding protein [Flavobacteriaceae bacterium]|nr:ABC transporter ATP-binding protein [Flavobacteriaceae bacterium]